MVQTPDPYHTTQEDMLTDDQIHMLLAGQIHLGKLSLEVSVALTTGGTLRELLTSCTEALVRHLNAAFARIWILNEEKQVLELQASSGMYTHLNGAHARVPVGALKIGLIAAERTPHLTNDVVGDPRVSDQEWARREGMVAFAGYPLVLGDRLIGVMGMFARHRLNDVALQTMASISNSIALGVERLRMVEERERLLVREQAARIEAEIAHQRLYDLVMQAPAVICVLRGPQHVYELVNPFYQQLVGNREIVGKPIREALPELYDQEFYNLLDHVYTSGEAYTGKEVKVFLDRNNDGQREEAYFNFVYQPSRDAAGNVDGILVHAMEVTEQVLAREALQRTQADLEDIVTRRTEVLHQLNGDLQRSNQELQEFAYVASHDLQEPLRKIQAFGNLLEEEYGQQLGDGRMYLERMRNAATRMRVLISDLLAFSRVTTKAAPFVQVDLNEVMREVIDDLGPRLQATQGAIEVGPLPSIEADPNQMYQMFQNLITNALKFHQPDLPPVVKVHAEATPGEPETAQQYILCIEDNGIGFDEKYLDRIFTVFQRLHRKNEYEGTGIGLAVVRKIVERHGGTVTAKSSQGHGATFIVTLPVVQSTLSVKKEIEESV